MTSSPDKHRAWKNLQCIKHRWICHLSWIEVITDVLHNRQSLKQWTHNPQHRGPDRKCIFEVFKAEMKNKTHGWCRNSQSFLCWYILLNILYPRAYMRWAFPARLGWKWGWALFRSMIHIAWRQILKWHFIQTGGYVLSRTERIGARIQ